ncbi:arabinogalactan O-methyltransferase 1-like [Humulus lupulus]|uniref:arabinogalactan O-methyltransferase 1-like n=1 Tax=Humulus lupulus TaxID=3486 RepID=UPI002B40C809|nr:arabinogalactan O-methyltransferase 1-like [Humulus lupulus]
MKEAMKRTSSSGTAHSHSHRLHRLRPCLLAVVITTVFITLAITKTMTNFNYNNVSSFLKPCPPPDPVAIAKAAEFAAKPTQLLAIVHYATSSVVPQQSIDEIRVSFDVLRAVGPCNFLVFGVGRDSLMWASLNPRGATLFLEEDPSWVKTVLRDAPILRAHPVKYRTRLSQADELISSYKDDPDCSPSTARLSPNSRCRLALTELPSEVYDTEWDLIMIDAPRGYFPAAPGRMAAIYSAAVMARARVGAGVTHVFVHDVNRRVEKMFAEEFLCGKFRVNAIGRLWHFAIPLAADVSNAGSSFC